jgi:hypothetical protein
VLRTSRASDVTSIVCSTSSEDRMIFLNMAFIQDLGLGHVYCPSGNVRVFRSGQLKGGSIPRSVPVAAGFSGASSKKSDNIRDWSIQRKAQHDAPMLLATVQNFLPASFI